MMISKGSIFSGLKPPDQLTCIMNWMIVAELKFLHKSQGQAAPRSVGKASGAIWNAGHAAAESLNYPVDMDFRVVCQISEMYLRGCASLFIWACL